MDINDVAAGHISRMRWNPTDQWVYSVEPTHPPLVNRRVFDQVQAHRGPLAYQTPPRPELTPAVCAAALVEVRLVAVVDARLP